MNNFQGQINPANAPVLNGGSTLTLLGVNTLAGLTFNDVGGTGNPTVNAGSYLTLTGPINATSNNPATTPIITGGQLDLSGSGTFSIAVNGYAPQGLVISSIIRNGGILKTGTGTLTLNAANVFAGGVNLSAGTLMMAAVNALGAGTFTIGDGTAIVGNGVTIANPVTVNGSFMFAAGSGTTGNLTMNGPVTLNSAGHDKRGQPVHDDHVRRADPRHGRHHEERARACSPSLGGGATNYTGPTIINGGGITLGTAYATSPSSDVTINSGAFLNAVALTQMMGALNGSGTLATTTATLYIGNTGSNGTFTGNLVGTAAAGPTLVKVGTGYQIINLANPATAPNLTALNMVNGTVEIDQNQTINAINFGWNLANATTQGNLVLASTATATLGGNITFNGYNNPGPLLVSSGTIALGAAGQDHPGRSQPHGQRAECRTRCTTSR